jgi:hypothetical protein
MPVQTKSNRSFVRRPSGIAIHFQLHLFHSDAKALPPLPELVVGRFEVSLMLDLRPRPVRTSALNDWLQTVGDSVTKPNRVRLMAPG